MDDCRASDSRHNAGPRSGKKAWTHTRGGAEQASEVAHPHAQPGASLLDGKGNRAARHNARPRLGSPAAATSHVGAKQACDIRDSVSLSALPIVEGQRSKIAG